MRRLWIYLLLVAALAVFAQQQLDSPDEPQASGEQAVGDGAEQGEDGPEGDEGPAAEDGAAEARRVGPDADGDGGSAAVEDAADQAEDEATAEADMEFEPDEEISEDYPVPLPSDI